MKVQSGCIFYLKITPPMHLQRGGVGGCMAAARGEHCAIYGIWLYSHGIIWVRVCPYPYLYGCSKEHQRHGTGVHTAVNGIIRVHYRSEFDFLRF